MEREISLMRIDKILKALLIAAVIVCMGLSAIPTEARESVDYAVSQSGDEYTLAKYEGDRELELYKSTSISELFENSGIENGSYVVMRGVVSQEDFILKDKNFTLTGRAEITGDFIVENSEILLDSIELSFKGRGGIRLKNGKLTIENSDISSEKESAIRLDYSSGAVLNLKNTELYSASDAGTLNITFGTANVVGGKISNSRAAAILNRGTLNLSGDLSFEAENYGIVTYAPINLRIADAEFSSKAKIKYEKEFKKGTLTEVLLKVSRAQLKDIELFDKTDTKKELVFFESSQYTDEENFAAVYLPYKMVFKDGEDILEERCFLEGEIVSAREPISKAGYKFLGWQLSDGGFFEFSAAPVADTVVNAAYELLPPEFLINSLKFNFDGKEHILGFDMLTHPLSEEGEFSYLWYREDECVSSTEYVKVRGVSQSGRYKCKLTFTHNGYKSEIMTEEVSVEVKACKVALPEILPCEYNGKIQYPSLASTELYSVETVGGIDAGRYPVTLSLYDAENYSFIGSEGKDITLDFVIIPAENTWVLTPTVENSYLGYPLSFCASAKFGEPVFLFSSSHDGAFTEKIPDTVGSYYFRASVSGTENYRGLLSEPIPFSVIPDEIAGISLKNPPLKLEYTAFEKFNASGAELFVSYAGGKRITVSGAEIAIRYQNSDCFLFGDDTVYLSFEENEISLPVRVKKADYDLGDFTFNDKTVVYDGKEHTAEYSGALPVGVDGILLRCHTDVSKKDVGIYEIKLVFETESPNYNVPLPISARLEITPLLREVMFENLEFIYDGNPKVPIAYFIDEIGAKIPLSVTGAASYAGSYCAGAVYDGKNYILQNEKCEFVILKADYDLSGIYWTESEFIYDNSEKSVTLSGLPEGVFVTGYTDAKATRAGTYLAKTTLSYDKINYNEPKIEPFFWTVRRSEYDISGFEFISSEAVYDGNEHYPQLKGEMPVGLDGIRLSYSFDKGALHVSEGSVKVTISFYTESENYNAPKSIERYVKLSPLGINVTWLDEDFVYTGEIFAPEAEALECGVYVVGGAANAGVHTAYAHTENSDYYVINSSFVFEIRRAENRFTEPLSVGDIYEGDAHSAWAESLSGDVIFRFFRDRELENETDAPKLPGLYYVIAESAGGGNYTKIVSEVKSFYVIKLVPIAIYPEITAKTLTAFNTLTENDFKLTVEYNSGKRETVEFQDVKIEYRSGESLRASDSSVLFKAHGLSCEASVSVMRASYDMSDVEWSESNFVYDGDEKGIYLKNLPLGVSVKAYLGNGKLTSGRYTVTAELLYDAENYFEPKVPKGEYVIEKAALKTPGVLPMTYCGEYREIELINADFCKYSKILYRDSGRYSVVLEAIDSENYVFELSGTAFLEIEFEIAPKEIMIKIHDVNDYLFEEPKAADYTILGEVFPEDDLMLEFIFEDEGVLCVSKNPNYKISFDGGKIIKKNYPSPKALALFFLFFLLLVLLTLFFVSLRFHRDNLKRLLVLSKNTAKNKTAARGTAVINPTQKLAVPLPLFDAENDKEPEVFEAEGIDNERADLLLSDSMAKTLVKRMPSVETFGNKKRIINVGAINSAFSPGENVDINRMKAASLIPYNTAYIKVLGDGILDKPLKVFANDFSLSAVKMIALTGGEAIKVNTVRIKMPRNEDE